MRFVPFGWLRLLSALSLTLAVFTPAAGAHVPSPLAGQALIPAARALGEQLTTDLVRLTTRYSVAAGDARARAERDLLTAALTRKRQLLASMDADPEGVLRLALPWNIRASLPPGVRAHVEREVDVEGTVEIFAEDGVGYARHHYGLATANGRLSLHFAGGQAPDDLLSGARIRVNGVQLEQALAADGSGSSVQLVTQALSSTFGVQKTLVMLVNFEDNPAQPYTLAGVRDVVFNTTSNYLLESSFGQTSLAGDVVGWYTLPVSGTVCSTSSISTAARQAATAAGVSLSAYTRYVYVFPQNVCTWAGWGSIGGKPSEAWINGSLGLRLVAHELGHNFGLYHSHNFECGTTVLGASCTVSDYGDTMDIMGSAFTAHYNAFQKERLGWLNYGGSPPLLTVSGSGTFTIEPYETHTTNPKGLKLLRSVDAATGKATWYYVEYRQAVGFDAFVGDNANLKTGVLLHLGTPGNGDSSYLLDMTAATESWFDPALGTGKIFSDRDTGITITPVWADARGAGVGVTFDPAACMRGVPTVSLAPGQSQWLPAGATATFTATVTNNDNTACGVSTIALQGVVPAGWTLGLGTSSLTLSPAQAASTTLTVTSAASAVDGFYTVGLTTSDASESAHAASATATVVIVAPLAASVATDRLTYGRPGSVTITTTVRAGGAAASGASVTLTITRPDGGVVTKRITTDTTGRAVVKLSLKKQDPAGTYRVVSSVTTGGLTGQASTTFQVQ